MTMTEIKAQAEAMKEKAELLDEVAEIMQDTAESITYYAERCKDDTGYYRHKMDGYTLVYMALQRVDWDSFIDEMKGENNGQD